MQNLVRITYPFLWIAVFARQLCLPVPAILFLMTAGALAGRGELRMSLVLAVGILGCLAGDLVWFEAGRFWGSRVMRVLCSMSSDPRYCAQRARDSFERFGLPSLMVVKFVPGLDGVTPPLAGVEGAHRSAFLAYDAVGSLFWSAFYAGLGYFFADSIDPIAAFLGRFGNALAFGIGVPLLIYVAWRTIVLIHMIRVLHVRRMSPSMLHQKLHGNERVAIIDLMNFEDVAKTEGIPGAIRIDPKRLRSRARVIMPEDLQVVLCCASPHEIQSARVALSLRKKGIPSVWILDGGLTAWVEQGFPVAPQLGDPREAAEHLGIRVQDLR